MSRRRIAILSSGSGTTAEAFISAVAEGQVDGEVVLLISNNQKAGVLDKVKKLNEQFNLDIKTLHIGSSNYPVASDEEEVHGHQTAAEEDAILQVLRDNQIDLILLLGYMKLVGPNIVKEYGWLPTYKSAYQSRMINTHPGLLPTTKGRFGIHVQQYVIDNRLDKAGHCLFAVDSEYDDGPVIVEHIVKVVAGETAEALFERVKASEQANIGQDVNNFILQQKKYEDIKEQ